MSEYIDDDENWLEDDSAEQTDSSSVHGKWRILIVDDELDVHAVTRLALKNMSFKDREIEIVSAYSGQEGFEILTSDPDICMVLLDVVMETENAGLVLARRIREELGNELVRIVLRTGQPGQAPEQKIIVDYDINDYKLKTELTAQKMFTCVISSLRAYEALKNIEANRRGLEKILQAVNSLYRSNSLRALAAGVLTHMSAMLDVNAEAILCIMHETSDRDELTPIVVASVGPATTLNGSTIPTTLLAPMIPKEQDPLPQSHPWSALITRAGRERSSHFSPTVNVLSIHATHGQQYIVALAPGRSLTELERRLLEIFCDRIQSAFDNLDMFELLKATQAETVIALAGFVESSNSAPDAQPRRVRRLTEAIATELNSAGLLPADTDPNFVKLVGCASMLHDICKTDFPAVISLEPDRHTLQERKIMQEQAEIGQAVLARASVSAPGMNSLKIATEIAGGHREHFDGSGYPRGTKGSFIPLPARIIAVVDVLEALLQGRSNQKSWPLPAVMSYLRERSGSQFDPDVVTALFSFLDREQPDWINPSDE